MIILENKAYDIRSHQLSEQLHACDANTWITVDWRHTSMSPDQLLEAYLPFVEACHAQCLKVKLILTVAKGVQFSQNLQPIVFCGHTYNPFRFDEVLYREKEINDA